MRHQARFDPIVGTFIIEQDDVALGDGADDVLESGADFDPVGGFEEKVFEPAVENGELVAGVVQHETFRHRLDGLEQLRTCTFRVGVREARLFDQILQFALALLQIADVGEHGDQPAVAGRMLADLHPAPVGEFAFADLAGLALGHQAVDLGLDVAVLDLEQSALDASAEKLRPQRAGRQFVGQFGKIVLVDAVRHHQPVVGIEQHEAVGDRLNRVEHLGARRLGLVMRHAQRLGLLPAVDREAEMGRELHCHLDIVVVEHAGAPGAERDRPEHPAVGLQRHRHQRADLATDDRRVDEPRQRVGRRRNIVDHTHLAPRHDVAGHAVGERHRVELDRIDVAARFQQRAQPVGRVIGIAQRQRAAVEVDHPLDLVDRFAQQRFDIGRLGDQQDDIAH